MSATLEKASFRTKPGVSQTEFLAASDALGIWARKQPGFQYRTVVRAQDGTWIDLVYWDSLANAKAAQENFMSAPQAKPIIELIDETTLQMVHLAQLQSSCAPELGPA